MTFFSQISNLFIHRQRRRQSVSVDKAQAEVPGFS